MIRTRVPALTLILSAVFATAPAFAQIEQRGSRAERETISEVAVTDGDGASYTATFKDELLTSLVSSGDIPQIRVRGVKTSGYLIRPRTHFVRELLKSVERI